MLPSELLRFRDLKRVGIFNWPTLKRRVLKDNFPTGRYIGTSRVWTLEEVLAWWDTRPKIKPAAPVGSRDSGRVSNNPLFTPGYSESGESAQPLQTNGRGER